MLSPDRARSSLGRESQMGEGTSMSEINRRRVLGAGVATVDGSMFQTGAAEPASAEDASAVQSGRSP